MHGERAASGHPLIEPPLHDGRRADADRAGGGCYAAQNLDCSLNGGHCAEQHSPGLTYRASAMIAAGQVRSLAMCEMGDMARKVSQPSVLPPGSSLHERLRWLRLRANLRQIDVAVAMNVSEPTVSEWEAGKKRPGGKNLEGLAVHYSVPLDWLLGREDAEAIRVQSADEAEFLDLLRGAPSQVRDAVRTMLRSVAPAERPSETSPSPPPHPTSPKKSP